MKVPYPILKFNFNQKFFFEDYFGNQISKTKYKFAKSFNDGYAIVYDYNLTWDIINPLGNSVLKDLKRPTARMVEKAFKYICPKDGFFLKNYVIKRNIILGVNIPELRKEFEMFDVKRFPEETNRQGYLIISLDDAQMMSVIEDYSMSGDGLIAIKHFDKQWIYISIESFNKHLLEKNHFNVNMKIPKKLGGGFKKDLLDK